MEAKLEQLAAGLAPRTDGWFVLNAGDACWYDWGLFGVYCQFEGESRFPQLGFNISVLQPGQSLGRYHREPGHQEDFLVVAGTCVLIIEDETRDLVAWDLVHCPPDTAHMIVGGGAESSVVISVGARGSGEGVSRGVVFPVSDVGRRFGVSVERETSEPSEAYADAPEAVITPYKDGWLPLGR